MKHGTLAEYTAGCKCDACIVAYREWHRDWQRERRAGRTRTVDVAEARAHLRLLIRSGQSMYALSAMTGLSDTILARIRDGKQKRIRIENADRILSLTLSSVAEGHLVPKRHVTLMMKEMQKAGWTRRRISAALGQDDITQLVNRRVYWKTYIRLLTLYRLLVREGVVPAKVLLEVPK